MTEPYSYDEEMATYLTAYALSRKIPNIKSRASRRVLKWHRDEVRQELARELFKEGFSRDFVHLILEGKSYYDLAERVVKRGVKIKKEDP